MKKLSKLILLFTSFFLVSCTPTGPNKKVPVESISFSEQTLEMEVGDTATLSYVVMPQNATDKSVKWSTDNSAIVSIEGSTLKAESKGTTTVYVTTNDGNKKASCSVTVSDPEPGYDTITVQEAVNIIENLEMNVISDKEYYVRGVVINVEKDENGYNGGFLNSTLKFRSIKENGVIESVDDVEGKEVIICGYLENYNTTYQIPYLPANYSPTGQKYNGKFVWVEGDSPVDTVDVTQVSISPVSKKLTLNSVYTLSATVLPTNATDKTLTWESSQPAICTVTQAGVIKGLSIGDAVITAKSNNNITATCDVSVTKNSDDPVEGNKYEIAFNKFESDGQTPLTSSSIRDQITAGSDYISDFPYISKVYKGMNGLKFGSTKSGGELDFDLCAAISSLECSEIILNVSQYGTKTATVSIYGNDELILSGSSSDSQIAAKLKTPKKLNSISITTSARAYLSKITIVCGDAIEIPVSGISIPSSKAISTGNSETLSVTYTPSNANIGKGITWSTNNASVATVSSSGVVTGVKAGNAQITATSQGGFTSTCNVTVSDISVTGVSLSPVSQTLSIGATKQLTATVSPSNASNKNVTWSSSNSTIASVSSSGLVTAKAVGNATITVKTVDGNKTATCAITVSAVQKDAWTVMIYMCGADLESENGLAAGDIKEILNVSNQPDNVNIVIQTGGAKKWTLGSTYLSGATKIDQTKVQRWHVANKKLVFDEDVFTYSNNNTRSMGTPDTLQSFVEYGIKEYPAEKTGIIFWNHGGAMYGCCYDEKKNDDSLLNSEMKSAFSAALSNTGSSKLEFVGYDTCLTQVQDIAEFNSKYFNYMIASEESESGYGWDYDTWVDNLYANDPTETILKAIVDGFIKDNGGASSYASDQTLSYLDLTQMPAYKTAFENFASALKSKFSSSGVSKSTFAKWMDNNVKAFAVDSESSETYFCLFDVKDMLNKLSSSSSYNPGSSYITAVNNAFSNLVKYSVAQKGAGNAYGLGCIYSQGSTDAYYIRQVYDSYETNFTNWLSFLNSYSYLGY